MSKLCKIFWLAIDIVGHLYYNSNIHRNKAMTLQTPTFWTMENLFGEPAYADFAMPDEILSALQEIGAEVTDDELNRFAEGELAYNSETEAFEELG